MSAALTPARRSMRRLLIPPLGVSLVLLVAAAWASGIGYLVVRAGLPAPVRLAVVDTVHVYVGLASLIFITAKIARVGMRLHTAGVQPGLLWHRWVSWSLVVLYAAVYISGALLLVGWRQDIRTSLANVHLLASVWAAVPTTWHAWHYRRLAFPSRSRRSPPRSWRRLGTGMGLVLLPALAFALVPRELSPLAAAGLGNSWTQAALPGVFLDKLEVTQDGRYFVAGGSGLYVEDRRQATWHRVAIPPVSGRDPVVLALATSVGPTTVYVGTAQGLYAAAAPTGPYRLIPFPARELHGIAVDQRNPRVIWVSSRGGFFRSDDGGDHWTAASPGIPDRETAWGLRYFHDQLFASDATGIYRWTGTSWTAALRQEAVFGFDVGLDGRRLYASSMGHGIQVFDGVHWNESDAGFRPHNGGVHVVTVNEVSGTRAYAATMEGTGASLDGGRSWLPFANGLKPGGVWRVLADGPDRLLAATDYGLYRYSLIPPDPPGAVWWLMLIAVVAVAALTGVATVALPKHWPAGSLALK